MVLSVVKNVQTAWQETRQGCPNHHCSLTFSLNYYTRSIAEHGGKNKGEERLVQALRFADELAHSQEGHQRIMEYLNMISLEYGMKINIKKTTTMKINT